MHKKEFIQCIIVRSLPSAENIDAAVGHAEWLWDQLSKYGYGPSKKKGSRQSENWYAKLQGVSKQQFDRFWNAFNHKQGRDGAAMRWYQLGDIPGELFHQILAAAHAEARRPLADGAVRKMAQGWLQEHRWEDHQPTKPKSTAGKKNTRKELQAEITALQNLYDKSPNDALKKNIDELKQRLSCEKEPVKS